MPAIQRDPDQAASRTRQGNGQLVGHLGLAVEVAVEAKRPELTVAEEIRDPQRASVAGGLTVGKNRMLGQMLPEQLGAVREVSHSGLGSTRYRCSLDPRNSL